MEIKMPIKFHAAYAITTRCDGQEKKERCQKLTINELSPQSLEARFRDLPEHEKPTHQITFYDFGCKRILNGKLKENEEESVVFQVQNKEYTFSLYRPAQTLS